MYCFEGNLMVMDFDGQSESSFGMASDKLTSTCAGYANTRVFAGVE